MQAPTRVRSQSDASAEAPSTLSIPDDTDLSFAGTALLADRFALVACLGEGAYARVFSALDLESTPPRNVAVKMLRSEHQAPSDRAWALLRRELAGLQRAHASRPAPNVVRALEEAPLTHEVLPFLVLELIDGPVLSDLLSERRSLPYHEAWRIARGLARGLRSIHAAGGVHRDLKPANVRLRTDGEPVILDLGIAQWAGDPPDRADDGLVPMTPRYASPEQLGGRRVGPSSDIYTLGLIFCEMLVGNVPPMSARRAARAGLSAPLFRAIKNVSSRKAALLLSRCLAHDPTRRCTAKELDEILSKLPPARTDTRLWGLVAAAALSTLLVHGSNAPKRISGGRSSHTERGSDARKSEAREVVTLASGQIRPYRIAVDAENVYWTNQVGQVMKLPRGGGDSIALARKQNQPSLIAVHQGYVYFTAVSDVIRVSAYGGPIDVILTNVQRPEGLAVDATGVYVTSYDQGRILKVAHDGARPATLYEGAKGPSGICVHGGRVFWTNANTGQVMSISVRGGPATVLASKQMTPLEVATDGMFIYWSNQDEGAVYRASVQGGRRNLIAQGSEYIGLRYLAVDGANVYWATLPGAKVIKAPIHGGRALKLISADMRPMSIALDSTTVYWIESGEVGSIMSAAK